MAHLAKRAGRSGVDQGSSRDLPTAQGDPVKVAQVVLTVADLDEPPLRLMLGKDAYTYGRAAWTQRLEEDEKWRELSFSTDHDDAEGDGSRWLADS